MKRTFQFLLFILAVGILQSCGQLRYLDIAQDNFSQAATLETKAREQTKKLGDTDVAIEEMQAIISEPLSEPSPDYYYTLALADVNKALAKRAELDRDGVLANALTLKALCLWKTRDYLGAASASKQALAELKKDKNKRLVRDKAVMHALPAFVDIDKTKESWEEIRNTTEQAIASGSINDAKKDSLVKSIKMHYANEIANENNTGTLEVAIGLIDEAREEAPSGHEVQTYLVLCQLSGLKTWTDELEQSRVLFRRLKMGRSGNIKWANDELIDLEKTNLAYLIALSKLLRGEDKSNSGMAHPIYEYWDLKLPTPDPEAENDDQ